MLLVSYKCFSLALTKRSKKLLFVQTSHLKNAVYERKPATIDDLMNFITEEAHKITTDMCQKVIQCFYRRQHTCVKNGGSSVEKY